MHANLPLALPPSSSTIGTLHGTGRDGSNFLETAKMCGISSAASLPAALWAGGSVFILFRKRCTGGKNGKWGLLEAGVATTDTLRSWRARVLPVATLAPNTRAFSKTENRPQNGNATTHVMCNLSLTLCLLPTYFFFSKI